MAKSAAKKRREKLVREGRRNPEDNRSPFATADLRSRKTKTKTETLYRIKHKNHSVNDRDGSFYYVFYVILFTLFYNLATTQQEPWI